MNTIQKLFVSFALLALVVGVLQLYTNIQKQSIPVPTKVVLQEKNDKKLYSINVEYPHFAASNNVEDALNTAIKSLINTTITSFVTTVEASKPIENLSSDLFIHYTIIQSSSSVVSVLFSVEDMQAGYAHPNNYNLPFNYSLVNKKILTIHDIFDTSTPAYLTFLSRYTTEQLAAKNIVDKEDQKYFFKTGLAPKVENFDKFVINENAITFVFDPAQVAPDVDGTQTVTIPMSSMQQYLK